MRYWRDPDTGDVIRANADAPADPGDVAVVPSVALEDLMRLMESARIEAGKAPRYHFATCASCGAVQALELSELGLCYLCCGTLLTEAPRSPEAGK